jgi:acyl CoA:acetate/3-ketoacid CoA transferase beta subunit
MAEENVDCFQEMEDPFGSGRKCGLVKALDVDLSLIHACAADPYGNTLLPAPYDETLWAPRASKNGVIVTVEQIVSTQFIREHSGLVRLPGYLVSSVSLVPLGAHPLCLVNPGVRDFIGYGADYDFMLDYRHSLNDLAALDAWIKEWVLDCPSHDHYLAKLGQERIQLLRSKSEENAWQQELESLSGQLSTEVKFNDTEMMIVAAARKIKQRIVAQGYRTLLTGIGAAGLAAWMAYLQLQEEGYGLDLLFGSGQYGFSPRPADPFMFNISNIPTCKMLSDFSEVYGVWAGGATNKCLVVLGAAQVDKHGNLNSSKINDLFLIGAGGAADSVNSQETMVVGRQSKNRFVEKASYISVPGNKVKTLVTNLGVFEKISDDTEFTVTQFCPEWSATAGQDPVRRVKDNCGWELKISQKVTQVSRPTQEELIMLRLLDPQAAYIGA